MLNVQMVLEAAGPHTRSTVSEYIPAAMEGLREVARTIQNHPGLANPLAIVAILVGILGAVTSQVAAAIASALVFLSVLLVVIYSLYVRDRYGGMYEVLDSEETWDFSDPAGQEALSRKRYRIRFIQNNAIAINDYAWGQGDLLAGYHCNIGRRVDVAEEAGRQVILIRLHRAYSRGEEEVVEIERTIRGGFLQADEWVDLAVVDGTKKVTLTVLFPKGREATDLMLERDSTRRTEPVGHLPLVEGRQRFTKTVSRPPARERIRLKWSW